MRNKVWLIRLGLVLASWSHLFLAMAAITATLSFFFTLPGLIGLVALVAVAKEMLRVWKLGASTTSTWLTKLYYFESIILVLLILSRVTAIGAAPKHHQLLAVGAGTAAVCSMTAGIALSLTIERSQYQTEQMTENGGYPEQPEG